MLHSAMNCGGSWSLPPDSTKCCHTTLQKLSVQLYNVLVLSARIICTLSDVGINFSSKMLNLQALLFNRFIFFASLFFLCPAAIYLSIYLSKKSRLGRRKCRDTTRAPTYQTHLRPSLPAAVFL